MIASYYSNFNAFSFSVEIAILQLLVPEYGADISMQDNDGNTALLYALNNLNKNGMDWVKLLLAITTKISENELESLMRTNNESIIGISLKKYGYENLSEKHIEKYKNNKYFAKFVLL